MNKRKTWRLLKIVLKEFGLILLSIIAVNIILVIWGWGRNGSRYLWDFILDILNIISNYYNETYFYLVLLILPYTVFRVIGKLKINSKISKAIYLSAFFCLSVLFVYSASRFFDCQLTMPMEQGYHKGRYTGCYTTLVSPIDGKNYNSYVLEDISYKSESFYSFEVKGDYATTQDKVYYPFPPAIINGLFFPDDINSYIEGADPNSFEMVEHKGHVNFDFAKDRNNVYVAGIPIEGANPETFRVLQDGDNIPYALDDNNVYEFWITRKGISQVNYGILEVADVSTFEIVKGSVAKDSNAIYFSNPNTPLRYTAIFKNIDTDSFKYNEEKVIFEDINGQYTYEDLEKMAREWYELNIKQAPNPS